MKLFVPCTVCQLENGGLPDFYFYLVDVLNEQYCIVKCRHGHTSATTITINRHELLFEVGVQAYIDGYYREAISAFTAALESFYRYYALVIATKNEKNVSELSDVWKTQLGSQSERQYGAYIATYYMENNAAPPTLSGSNRNFRNDVIHKGRIPTQQQAIKYGGSILECLLPVISTLRENYPEAVEKVFYDELAEATEKTPVYKTSSGYTHQSILRNTSTTKQMQAHLEQWITEQRQMRQLFLVINSNPDTMIKNFEVISATDVNEE